jgi:aryl-alcohol dehydrogenase-like predicted oxidoreductase
MERRTLGRTDLNVSVIGFGGIPIQGIPSELSGQIVRGAVDLGINFFDTARGYTDSEAKLGEALEGRRNEVILATKSMARDRASMSRDIETSLRLLRTDRIDLYQVHNPSSEAQINQVCGPGGALEALATAQQAGKVRYIGITGHSRELLLKAMETGVFDTVQHPLNPLETGWQKEVGPAARRLGLGAIAMKPVAGGALAKVAKASLRWCLQHGADVAIPGMDSMEAVRTNASVGQRLRPPSEDEMTQLQAVMDRWEGAFCRRCGYCLPCPEGLNIPFLLLIEAYYSRYGLKAWALERLGGLDKTFARCPYDLPVAELMSRFATQVRS